MCIVSCPGRWTSSPTSSRIVDVHFRSIRSSALSQQSEPWILAHWYQASSHQTAVSRAPLCLLKRAMRTNST
jgi:hypothetical protein